MWTDDDIREFGWNIQKLIDRQDMTRQESYEMFRQVLLNRQPDLQQGAFLAALKAKGETPQEIAGAWEAIVEIDTTGASLTHDTPLVENSGTGMDQLKTFNVSSAAAVVAAAGGARMARHGSRALTSTCGTVDLLEALGIDVECNVEKVEKSIEQAGIGLFNGMSPKIHPQSLGRILSQIRFGSTLNIAASLASPCRPTHALRGVWAPDVIDTVSAVMKAIGYQRGIVVHGLDARGEKGMDEISTLGESTLREFFPDGGEETYTISPEDFGLKRADYADVAATGDVGREAVRFLKVVAGVDHPECIDFTCLNAGAILYLIGKANDIQSGVEIGKELIHSGKAIQKLVQWVSVQSDDSGNGNAKLLEVSRTAGLQEAVSGYVQ
jgi:anthranilate phosphoribosyltransferase